MATTPQLTLQTATLYASGVSSTFTGTGGPWGFSPFTGQFGGTISSAGLLSQPFNDTVYNVAAGDDLTFVIAVQNTSAAPAYNVALRDIMPPGFVLPPSGLGLTVTDGLGNDLATTGDLFSAAGLLIAAPLQAYDPNSGQNIDLISFSLDAGAAVPGPYAALQATAVLTGFAAAASGANLAPANPASATTTIVTAAPSPVVTPESDPSALAVGQTIAFDVATTIPVGTLQNFTISPVLPPGAASLQLVSSSVTSIGSALHTAAPVIGPDGSIAFGNVTLAAGATGGTSIVTRIVVRAAGTLSGPARLETLVSAGNAASGAGFWSAGVYSSVHVVAPPPPPTLSGLAAAQAISTNGTIAPFGALVINGSNTAQTGTLAITLLDPTLGKLGDPAGSVNAACSTVTMSGPLAALQAAARQLVFTPGAIGTARLTITVIDSTGGVAQDTSTAVTVTAPPLTPDPLFDAGYYLAHNPDVAATGIDPLLHYELSGWKEGRNPSAAFDTRDYLAANLDVKAANVDPLLHYAQHGQAEGRAEFAVPNSPPDPLVDAAAYYAANPDVRAAGLDASAHYLASGWHEGRDPSPFFDTSYYLAQNPDVRAAGIDPLLHFEQSGWKEGRAPSLMFDDAKYLAANPDVSAAGIDPLLHYEQSGQAEGRMAFLTGATLPADPLVNAAYYDQQLGATLIPTGSAGAQQAAWSYDASGWQKGLNPDPLFNTQYYLSHNPDVAAAHIDPLLHYETSGWKEGRDPSAQFSTNKYLAAYADVRAAGVDPLLHYITSGQAEGRHAFNV